MDNWNNIEFTHPQFLWLLVVVPLMILWYYLKRNSNSAPLTLSNTSSFGAPSILTRLKPILYVLRIAAISLLVIALARPRITSVSTKVNTNKGIDIVMAIDVSASMLAKDLQPNRLEALKKVANNFIQQRPNDRIGIVVYAGESFTQTPITSDKRIVKNTIDNIEWGQLDGGTAIGMGLGSAVNRLKESKAKSKVIILLTDGVNNAGFVDPKTATELAKELDIKVYTIGIGTKGMALSPVSMINNQLQYQKVPVEIDEELLKYIANETNGKYFRATDNSKLRAIYSEINKLEKTEIEEFKYYNYDERYRSFAILAGFFLLLEMVLKLSIFRSFI